MYRVISTVGEGVPTRIFCGDYDTLAAAERAKKNIEASTHYQPEIEDMGTAPSAARRTILTKGRTKMTELHLAYRPIAFKELVGQPDAVSTLKGMRAAVPHTIMFSGPSGCGKTTAARILADKLKCHKDDLEEINSADCRGIDDIRAIAQRMRMASLGPVRVYIIDEAQGLTPQAQDAFLKMSEEPPRHVYFFLATTDPLKLKKTVRTRCTEVKFKAIAEPALVGLVQRVAAAEGKPVSDAVAKRIAECSEESARKSLKLLQAVIDIPEESTQLGVIEEGDVSQEAINLARALMAKKGWKTVAAILKDVQGEPESLRYLVLGYARSVLLNSGNPRAMQLIEAFQYNFYDSKAAGLAAACYGVTQS